MQYLHWLTLSPCTTTYNEAHRHYHKESSDGESSPELPVLSKSRGYRPPGAQARAKAPPPSSPPDSDSAYYAGYNSSEEYDGEGGGAYFDKEVKSRLHYWCPMGSMLGPTRAKIVLAFLLTWRSITNCKRPSNVSSILHSCFCSWAYVCCDPQSKLFLCDSVCVCASLYVVVHGLC